MSRSEFRCQACVMTFTGQMPYGQHLASAKHKKKMLSSLSKNPSWTKESDLAIKMDCEPTVCDKIGISPVKDNAICINKGNCTSNGLIDSNTLLPSSSQNFLCDICDVMCTGIEPFNMHLAGAKHKKKAGCTRNPIQSVNISSTTMNDPRMVGISPIPNAVVKTAVPSNNGSTSSFYCKLCDKICSGDVPYMAHLKSQKHMKKQLAAGILDSGTSSSDGSALSLSSPTLVTEDEQVIYDLDALNITVFFPDQAVTFDVTKMDTTPA